jgi:hypothetical protein
MTRQDAIHLLKLRERYASGNDKIALQMGIEALETLDKKEKEDARSAEKANAVLKKMLKEERW